MVAPATPAASVTQARSWGIQQQQVRSEAAATASAAAVQLGPGAVQTWEQGQQPGGWEEEEGDVCVICHERWAGVMLVHGADGHMCVCEACSTLLPPGAPCPLCRRLIEQRVVVEG